MARVAELQGRRDQETGDTPGEGGTDDEEEDDDDEDDDDDDERGGSGGSGKPRNPRETSKPKENHETQGA